MVFKMHMKDNVITGYALRDALATAGYNLKGRDRMLKLLVRHYVPGDGNIAFEDFLKCTIKMKTASKEATKQRDEQIASGVVKLAERIVKGVYRFLYAD